MKSQFLLLSILLFTFHFTFANNSFFALSSNEICSGDEVVITPIFSSLDNYLWDFGNGITSTEPNPGNILYEEPGNYTISLQAFDTSGLMKISSVTISNIPNTWGQNFITDPLPDLYLIIYDLQGNVVCSTPPGNYNYTIPYTFYLNSYLLPGQYTMAVWEYDLFGGDDYLGTVTFNGEGAYNDVNTGMQLSIEAEQQYEFIFSQTLSVGISFENPVQVILCDGATYNLPDGTIVTEAGTYTTILPNVLACDSVLTTEVFIGGFTEVYVEESICSDQVYTLPDGQQVAESGVYESVLSGSEGCDSIVITNLLVSDDIGVSLEVFICKGGDYVLPDGNVVNEAGVYQVAFVSELGCDSTVTIYVEEFEELFLADTLVIADTGSGEGSISIEIDGGNPPYSFLWSNGETGSEVTNLTMGNYSVTVMDECGTNLEFSIFVPAQVVSSFEPNQDLHFNVYPNPFTDRLLLEVVEENLLQNMEIQLFNSNGSLVLTKQVTKDILQIELGFIPAGVYIIRIVSDDTNLGTLSIIKQ